MRPVTVKLIASVSRNLRERSLSSRTRWFGSWRSDLHDATTENTRFSHSVGSSLMRNPIDPLSLGIFRDANVSSSPGRFSSIDLPEPRIPLTRVDIDEKHTRNLASYYPTLSQTKPTYSPSTQETITHSFSPQRSSAKPETRPSTTSYGLRNPYDFQTDEPVATRQEHKATPFRATNISSVDTLPTNTNRFARASEVPSSIRSNLNTGSDFNEIRSRISSSINEQKDTKATKTLSTNDFEKKTSADKDQVAVAVKSKFIFEGEARFYSCFHSWSRWRHTSVHWHCSWCCLISLYSLSMAGKLIA